MTTELPIANLHHPATVPPFAVPVTLGDNDAAVLDAFVAPSYLRMYWEAAKAALLVGEASRVVHLGSRTGYPDAEILAHMPNTFLVSVESNAPLIQVAKTKLAAAAVHYQQAPSEGTGLPEKNFSHALCLHPVCDDMTRVKVFEEMHRLLYEGGQAVVAMPLSRSFPEILDLLSEYALKHDALELGRALEDAAMDKLTIETLSDDLENAGLSDIDFQIYQDTLSFDSGRALLEDPSIRYLIVPQIAHWLDQSNLSPAMEYVSRAIDKYWSEEKMDVTVVIAAMSARR